MDRIRLILLAALLLLAPTGMFAQATDGNVVGVVSDASGAAVPGATIELQNDATGVKFAAKTDTLGAYRFNNVPAGVYTLKASASGFTAAQLQRLSIELNKTTTANLSLQVGQVSTTVEVLEAPATIDTTTAQITTTFQSRQAVDVPIASLPLGPINLSLLSAGVASSGGLGLGEGPAIGGQRPRNNSFTIEGVDNNRKDVTGSNVRIPNEATAEVTILQNSYSAEFGHSGGGVFNTIIKSGTNEIHGTMYNYLQNRNLNAVDEAFARVGIRENTRYDQNRLGANVGGPVIKNKLFYFGNFEYNPLGQASTPSAATLTPTAEGYAALQSLPGLSRTNLDIMRQYVPAAPTATTTTSVGGRAIPIGELPIEFPQYQNTYTWLVSVDYNISERDQLRSRYIDQYTSGVDPLTSPNLPVFAGNRQTRSKAFNLSEFHTFTPNITNELRLGYNRYDDGIPYAGSFAYPNLDIFPNIYIQDDLNLQIGPYPEAPQSSVINTYQVSNNLNVNKGRHALKFGAEGRKYIAPNNFVQRSRGDYNYSSMERYLLDLTPDVLAERNLGGVPYAGNQVNFYAFVNDNWRLRPNLTLNLGVRYEYKGITAGDKLQELNATSSRPGFLDFRAPKVQKLNFAPRVGIAWSPGRDGLTSIRAGFNLAYDNLFDNLGTLQKPIQLESNIQDDITRNDSGYLAQGGIRPDRRPAALSPEDALANTATYIPDQKLPYSISWNFGIQRVVARDYTFEARYVGTRGVRLFVQDRINVQNRTTESLFLPTYLQAPSQAELDRLTVTLNDIQARSNLLPAWENAGYVSPIVAFNNRGNSSYHGLALEATRRFSNNLMFKGAYTWSKTMDDSTADLFSTLLSPRRPQDFQNWRSERSRSFLDRTHRLTFTWIYDTPWFSKADNWFMRNLVGNWTLSGIYTAESPQYATVQSGVDSNQNGDAAGDRAIVNPAGKDRTGSAVRALTNSAGRTVAYVALNPDARYIVAGVGARPTGGRNTLPMGGINNWDLTVIKKVALTESKRLELRGSFFNSMNHPQYTPGSINTVQSVDSAATRNHLIPGNALFNDPTRVFASNARTVQIIARFVF
ncbi:MAG: carboxypeptidase regulatory-like domain-containing protein [Bryobacteraceae bacterium]|nr:carboxypeptidase regulatory-like domain-containing protein [Bryobacteraceae bacterium]